ncbi:LPS export ABC transporter periplasmic protein LptC [Rhizobiales bacterium RZME27]|jgi:lipopolysaccharide export system protein LptC|uniref:LPS export ABC transporter periplasmic protein LptC n=1 Tax=Endobacterium cereale TaxID=2663029 RepID=A0A6A8A4L2_9HYPH|nr:LPS export ABC transporter periplasmic protein LptC [Endobacterium cereale]MEB2844820.1 LPS export ABC transporter periplasmic protein LptC [Endobacterium cereale]MQY44737.1 LPS export ABC transporter periplasmic protein LptC [Endobacterium cereale]
MRQTRAYKLAQAHSSRVKRLKVLLPVAALIISLLFIGVSFIRTFLPENLTIQSAKIEDGKIVMESPAIAGRNDDGVSYSMTATRALQDIADPNMISLENVKAAMPMSKDVIARVAASAGIFDRATDRMQMTAPFDVNLSNGLTAKFQSANMDVKAGTLETPDTITISTPEASIVADSMKITDKGKTITFTGGVRVDLEAASLNNQDK